jgi:hypothetical protein
VNEAKRDAAQIIKGWCDDLSVHATVFCDDWTPFVAGIKTECEACGLLVSVWPIIVETAKANPLFHILCERNCLALCIKFGGPLPFGEHIGKNELPESLKAYRR